MSSTESNPKNLSRELIHAEKEWNASHPQTSPAFQFQGQMRISSVAFYHFTRFPSICPASSCLLFCVPLYLQRVFYLIHCAFYESPVKYLLSSVFADYLFGLSSLLSLWRYSHSLLAVLAPFLTPYRKISVIDLTEHILCS